jgi:hypothetical protein
VLVARIEHRQADVEFECAAEIVVRARRVHPSQTVPSAAGRAGVGGHLGALAGACPCVGIRCGAWPDGSVLGGLGGHRRDRSVVLTSYFYVQLWVRFLRRFDSRPSLPVRLSYAWAMRYALALITLLICLVSPDACRSCTIVMIGTTPLVSLGSLMPASSAA